MLTLLRPASATGSGLEVHLNPFGERREKRVKYVAKSNIPTKKGIIGPGEMLPEMPAENIAWLLKKGAIKLIESDSEEVQGGFPIAPLTPSVENVDNEYPAAEESGELEETPEEIEIDPMEAIAEAEPEPVKPKRTRKKKEG